MAGHRHERNDRRSPAAQELPQREEHAAPPGCSPPTTSASRCSTSPRSPPSSSSAAPPPALMRLHLTSPDGRDLQPRRLQPRLHAARRDHGLVLPRPGDPGHARQLHRAADDRRPRPGLPAPQPAELVPVHGRRPRHALGAVRRAASTLAGPSTRRSRPTTRTGHIVLAVVGIFISGFSSIATGLNFIVTIHRLRAPGMTWFRLPLFIWSIYATSVLTSWPRRSSPSPWCCSPSSASSTSASSTGARRRPAAVPAHVLVLQPPRRLHHDPARLRRRQRSHPRLRPQETVRL